VFAAAAAAATSVAFRFRRWHGLQLHEQLVHDAEAEPRDGVALELRERWVEGDPARGVGVLADARLEDAQRHREDDVVGGDRRRRAILGEVKAHGGVAPVEAAEAEAEADGARRECRDEAVDDARVPAGDRDVLAWEVPVLALRGEVEVPELVGGGVRPLPVDVHGEQRVLDPLQLLAALARRLVRSEAAPQVLLDTPSAAGLAGARGLHHAPVQLLDRPGHAVRVDHLAALGDREHAVGGPVHALVRGSVPVAGERAGVARERVHGAPVDALNPRGAHLDAVARELGREHPPARAGAGLHDRHLEPVPASGAQPVRRREAGHARAHYDDPRLLGHHPRSIARYTVASSCSVPAGRVLAHTNNSASVCRVEGRRCCVTLLSPLGHHRTI